jgi:TRAP-type C4-dicarboxylate transport system permease small subunit
MLCTLVWYNFPILELQMGGSMLSTGWSFVWLYAPVSVGSVLMLFYQSRLMILTLLNYQAQLERGT